LVAALPSFHQVVKVKQLGQKISAAIVFMNSTNLSTGCYNLSIDSLTNWLRLHRVF